MVRPSLTLQFRMSSPIHDDGTPTESIIVMRPYVLRRDDSNDARALGAASPGAVCDDMLPCNSHFVAKRQTARVSVGWYAESFRKPPHGHQRGGLRKV